jgi:hypothetical protein
MNTLHEEQNTFFIVPLSFVLRLRNILGKIREHQNKLLMFSNVFRKSCHLWDNEEKYLRAEQATVTIWHIRFACCIPNSTNTRWECWFFHWNSGCTNTPQHHVISTVHVLNSQFTEWLCESDCLSCLNAWKEKRPSQPRRLVPTPKVPAQSPCASSHSRPGWLVLSIIDNRRTPPEQPVAGHEHHTSLFACGCHW